MNFLKTLLSEFGGVSTTRFVVIIVALTVCFLSIWCSVYRIPTASDISLITLLLSIVSGLKYKQKKVENKQEVIINKDDTVDT